MLQTFSALFNRRFLSISGIFWHGFKSHDVALFTLGGPTVCNYRDVAYIYEGASVLQR